MATQRYGEIADRLQLKGKSEEEKVISLIHAIDALKKSVGIPSSIKDAGVPEEIFLAKLDQMSEDAFDDQCTGTNPRFPLISEIKEIYLRAYYGDDPCKLF